MPQNPARFEFVDPADGDPDDDVLMVISGSAGGSAHAASLAAEVPVAFPAAASQSEIAPGVELTKRAGDPEGRFHVRMSYEYYMQMREQIIAQERRIAEDTRTTALRLEVIRSLRSINEDLTERLGQLRDTLARLSKDMAL